MIQATPIVAAAVFLLGGSLAVAQTPTAADLQLEIDALNMMNTASGPMIEDAQTRSSQMNEFIAEQDLDGEWKSYAATDAAPLFDGLTFEEVIEKAKGKQREKGESVPFTYDVGALQSTVAATTVLLQSRWNKINTLHTQNAALTGFLKKHDKMDGYHEWAEVRVAERNAQADADREVARGEREESDAEQKKVRQENEAQRQAENESAAELRRSLDVQQYTDSTSTEDDESYYNGYSDPYYDVWGHPVARHNVRQEKHNNNNRHDAYKRSNSQPNAAPSQHHRSRGRR